MTVEDLRQMLPILSVEIGTKESQEQSFFNRVLEACSENQGIDYVLRYYLTDRFSDHAKVAYMIALIGRPLREMPLYLNSKSQAERIVAKWRLRIGE